MKGAGAATNETRAEVEKDTDIEATVKINREAEVRAGRES